MKTDALKVLMKKDWRVFRTTIWGAVILTVLPYVVSLVIFQIDRWQPYPRLNLSGAIFFPAVYGLLLTALMGAVFGAGSMAGERQDRSADFMDMLPPPRTQRALSKLLVILSIISSCVVVHFVLLAIGTALSHSGRTVAEDLTLIGCGWIMATLMLFGIAWMLSTFLKSAAICACVAILVVITACTMIKLISNELQLMDWTQAVLWGSATLLFGPVCWAVGTIYYLRRVEP